MTKVGVKLSFEVFFHPKSSFGGLSKLDLEASEEASFPPF